MSVQCAPLSDGRWHFQHGPIDLVIGAQGLPEAVQLAHQAAWQRFGSLLEELVSELPLLRQAMPMSGPLPSASANFIGTVAQRMWDACTPYRASFITPMAAVAGAVAEELIACYQRPGIDRAWVNNGGDIAVHLTPGHSVRIGLFSDLGTVDKALEAGPDLRTDAQCTLGFDWPVRGIATSGWRGRSFSLGIADSVTILAASAAQADAAATVVANAVNLLHPGIVRRPACEVKDDSDLGSIPVTVDVPLLAVELVQQALAAGLAQAQVLQQAGLLWSATLMCQGQCLQTPTLNTAAIGDHAAGFPQLGSVFA
ncbi:UPF0280 family protein [Rhodoferax sp.]|uniref:UPF0280 family protein n=1 Tax=Rhodoferax sp. TaxID=50421 RepID=UPI00374D64F5